MTQSQESNQGSNLELASRFYQEKYEQLGWDWRGSERAEVSIPREILEADISPVPYVSAENVKRYNGLVASLI